jgi:hypothetical protein
MKSKLKLKKIKANLNLEIGEYRGFVAIVASPLFINDSIIGRCIIVTISLGLRLIPSS